ncbi:MAG TPA: VCBS repeat-containing protein, partial [Planctomycetota bacterium]|nr:VCBS repeat-containing protein [Planctomycetota bacterium]
NQPGLFPPGTSNYSDYVAATDLTGDGLVDLALHRGASLKIWRSDASGAFTDVSAQWNPMGWGPYDVRPADVDLDGRMDLYVGIDDPAVMRNTGTSLQMLGNVSATVYPVNVGPSMAVVADFDGDRDVDVAYGVAGFASAQWNLRHHLALPLFAKPGASMPIKVYRTPGLATVPCLAAVATSFGRMRQETPVGTLWIDPFGPLDVQLALLPAPLGTADASLPIPGWYFLQGVELTVQALLFDSVSGLVLTNGVTTVIR